MTLPIVLICDDDADRAERWQQHISAIPGVDGALDVQSLPTADFAAALLALSVRRETAREGAGPADDAAAVVDEAAMLVVDYDLTIGPEDQRGQAETEDVKQALRGRSGEQFAYLARCYSRAGFIVLVNQEYKRRTFDLTMQRFVHSYADLNVQRDDIVSAELWTGEGGGYRPSHWPRLLDAPSLHASRLDAAEPSAKVLETLGIRGRDAEALTARQLDPLGGEDPSQVTFAHLVDGVDGGLDPKDEQPDEWMRRSIAAAAVARWLESTILPAQNALSDAAHLAQRFPSIVTSSSPAAWQAVGGGTVPAGLDVAEALAVGWATRPVWSVHAVREAAKAASGPLADPAPLAWCEDVSDFREFGAVREYESDVPGTYDQRFVARLDDVAYHPLSRLLRA